MSLSTDKTAGKETQTDNISEIENEELIESTSFSTESFTPGNLSPIEGGVLYLTAVPIGNLEDFTLRSLRILAGVSVIASEEVQATKRLLNSQNIQTRIISYRESGRDKAALEIIGLLKDGQSVALVSGAGTPAISDPGRDIVEQCHQLGIKVSPIPGVSALTAAISAAGIPSRRFVFEGFLPRKDTQRREFLQSLKEEERTMVFFEAPHRIKETASDILNAFGQRRLFIGRELTKKFEECTQTNLADFVERVKAYPPRGEFALVIEGFQKEEQSKEDFTDLIEQDADFLKSLGLSSKTALETILHFRKAPRNLVKRTVINCNKDNKNSTD